MRLLSILALVGFTAAVTLAGLAVGMQKGYEAGYQQGLKDAPEMTEQEFKKMLVANQDFLNKTCHVWWFGMTVKERYLK
jgi:hypothetical protein